MRKTFIGLALFTALIIPTAAFAAPNLTVDVSKDDTPAGEPFTVSVTGTATPHSKVTVNGHRVQTDAEGKFSFTQSVTGDVYEYDYTVRATYQGETTTVTKSVYVDVDPPELTLENPASATLKIKSGYYLWFDWYDQADDKPTLYVNGQKRSYVKGGRLLDGGYTGAIPITVQEGTNTFTLKLVNRYGRESETVTKVFYYNP
jgi:hypothetical protein